MAKAAAPRRVVKSPTLRREEILAAALRLFHERGFDETTVQHIADAAGVAAGTVYLYFPSKEHILLDLHSECHHEIDQTIQAEAEAKLAVDDEDADYRDTVDVLLDAMVSYITANRDKVEVVMRYIPRVRAAAEHHDVQSSALLAALLRLGVERGRIHVTDPEMAARLLMAAVTEPLTAAVVSGDDDLAKRLAAQAKELFHKALAPR